MLSLMVCGSPAASAAFVCPVQSAGADAAAVPAGQALGDANTLNGAIAALREKGLGNAMIVDRLIASYCPVVAGNAALNDDQKRAQVRHFAARTVRLVYALESAGAVFLDVPFQPEQIDAINARAAAERISPEAWVAGVVDRALKGAR